MAKERWKLNLLQVGLYVNVDVVSKFVRYSLCEVHLEEATTRRVRDYVQSNISFGFFYLVYTWTVNSMLQ